MIDSAEKLILRVQSHGYQARAIALTLASDLAAGSDREFYVIKPATEFIWVVNPEGIFAVGPTI